MATFQNPGDTITGIAEGLNSNSASIAPTLEARPKCPKTGGRLLGSPNRITRDVRSALKDIAEGFAGRVHEWIDTVAADDPAEAVRLYLALIRFVLPQLSAATIADITPRNEGRAQLFTMTDVELMAIAMQDNPRRLIAPTSALPNPYPSYEDDEMLK